MQHRPRPDPAVRGRSTPPVYRVRSRLFTTERLDALPGPALAGMVGLLCVVFGLSVVWRGDASDTAAGFWPPAGVALVAMLVHPFRRWGWVAAGIAVPTAVGLGLGVMPAPTGLLWLVANCVEPALAALVLRRFVASPWFTRGRLLAVFLGVAVVGAPLVGGAIGTVGTVLAEDVRWTHVLAQWVMSDGLGVLVVTPLFLADSGRSSARRTRGEWTALLALVGAATAVGFLDLGANSAALLPYLILAALVWAGMRFGTRAAAGAGFVVGLGTNLATSLDLGPFADTAAHAITLPIFLAIALVTSFLVATLAGDLAGRDEVHRLLTHQATHDQLTGLPNRALLADELDRAVEPGHGTGATVVVADLRDFKKVNDRRGRSAGDDLLVEVADRLATVNRPGHLLARLGGDQFVVLAPGLTDPAGSAVLAGDVLRAVGVDACAGVAVVAPGQSATGEDLLHRADLALGHAKRTGAQVASYDQELEASTRRRLDIDEELRGAIDRDELSVAYQPIVSLATGRTTSFEALARWDNRRFGPVAPDEFIGVAESTGFVDVIGGWVLDAACRQAAQWRRDLAPHVRVAVNVSARQLGDRGFPPRVARALERSGLDPTALTLEITETAVMDDLDLSAGILEELRAMGVRLSMDDFGTGYSSLSNLRRIPLDTLKVDRSFVAGLGSVAEDTAIVGSIVELGHSFGLEVVAEGVETDDQLAHLVRLGCDLGQGYLWSRPVDAGTAASLLAAAPRVRA